MSCCDSNWTVAGIISNLDCGTMTRIKAQTLLEGLLAKAEAQSAETIQRLEREVDRLKSDRECRENRLLDEVAIRALAAIIVLPLNDGEMGSIPKDVAMALAAGVEYVEQRRKIRLPDDEKPVE
jgi:hypothetical protein